MPDQRKGFSFLCLEPVEVDVHARPYISKVLREIRSDYTYHARLCKEGSCGAGVADGTAKDFFAFSVGVSMVSIPMDPTMVRLMEL